MRAYLAGLGMLAAFAAGCTSDGVGQSGGGGAGDVDAGVDAGEPAQSTSLDLGFVSATPVPGPIDGDYAPVLSRARISLRDVRVIGDPDPTAARTTVDQLVLEFDVDTVPPDVGFDDVLPGIYSKVRGRVVSYEIRGSIELPEGRVPFKIEDAPPDTLFSVDIALSLEPGDAERIDLEVGWKEVIAVVPWPDVPSEDGGEREVEAEYTPELMEPLRQKISEMFSAR